MAGMWTNTGDGWELGLVQAFEDEKELHSLIEENPQLLPLDGSPRLAVLGSEVKLGTGYADILAVEFSGRPVIIEVKLHKNLESHRAIVSQIIYYAAFLRGFDVEGLEQISALREHLASAGYESILEAVKAQAGEMDEASFRASLQGFLARGDFRLVLVLDKVSEELERVVAYLDAMTVQGLTIDLVTVKKYEVNGVQLALPERISPDIDAAPTIHKPYGPDEDEPPGPVEEHDGVDAFKGWIADVTGETRRKFDDLIAWAEQLGSLPNIRLFSRKGSEMITLIPGIALEAKYPGLVTIFSNINRPYPYVSVYRSVFERLAPNSIEPVERAIADTIGKGSTAYNITPEALDALTAAYREACGA